MPKYSDLRLPGLVIGTPSDDSFPHLYFLILLTRDETDPETVATVAEAEAEAEAEGRVPIGRRCFYGTSSP